MRAAGMASACIAGLLQEYPALAMTNINEIAVLLTVPESVMAPSLTDDKWFLNVDDCRAGFPDLSAR